MREIQRNFELAENLRTLKWIIYIDVQNGETENECSSTGHQRVDMHKLQKSPEKRGGYKEKKRFEDRYPKLPNFIENTHQHMQEAQ